MNGKKVKVLQVRTPVVIYEDCEAKIEKREITKSLHRINISAAIPKKVGYFERFKNIYDKPLEKSMPLEPINKLRSKKKFDSEKLKKNKWKNESFLDMKNEKGHYQDIIDKIASRIKGIESRKVGIKIPKSIDLIKQERVAKQKTNKS